MLFLHSTSFRELLQTDFAFKFNDSSMNQNTQSINCTLFSCYCCCYCSSGIVAILSPQPALFLYLSFCLLLHGPFLSPQTSQIQFSPIYRGGINWSVCRSNSQGTLYSKLEKILFERFEENEFNHCCTALYCSTLYYI